LALTLSASTCSSSDFSDEQIVVADVVKFDELALQIDRAFGDNRCSQISKAARSVCIWQLIHITAAIPTPMLARHEQSSRRKIDGEFLFVSLMSFQEYRLSRWRYPPRPVHGCSVKDFAESDDIRLAGGINGNDEPCRRGENRR